MNIPSSFTKISRSFKIGGLGLKVILLIIATTFMFALTGCGGGDADVPPMPDSVKEALPKDNPISFLSYPVGQRDIYVVGIDGTGLRRISVGPNDDVDPVWSPDGKSVAFASHQRRGSGIYVSKLDGTDPILVELQAA